MTSYLVEAGGLCGSNDRYGDFVPRCDHYAHRYHRIHVHNLPDTCKQQQPLQVQLPQHLEAGAHGVGEWHDELL